MNPQDMMNIKNDIAEINSSISDIMKKVSSLDLNQQQFVINNIGIHPGIASKIAYDSKGLILNGMKLEEYDIPELSIDKIQSLRKLLEDKVSFSDLKKLQFNSANTNKRKDNKVIDVGCKVSYNEDGCIVSSSDLTVDDIPDIPINKVMNLNERLSLIESIINTPAIDTPKFNVIPGTSCKITYDDEGRVVSGTKLSIDDIPMDLIIKINSIESIIPDLALSKSLQSLYEDISSKVESNSYVTPGVFSKVTIDSKGLIIKGDKLSINDLPDIKISDIDNLQSTLNNKADRDTLIELNEVVSSIVNSITQIGEITGIKQDLIMKAEKNDLIQLSSKLTQFETLINTLNEKIPNDSILKQLELIQLELSSLSGRIIVIEKELKLV